VKEDEKIARSPVQDAITGSAVMATQLAELTVDLRAVRVGEMGLRGRQQVQARDLVVEGHLRLDWK
jgi:hypothetical protein